jgi:hypothetical protein
MPQVKALSLSSLLVGLAPFALVVACGGDKPEPKVAPPPEVADASEPSPAADAAASSTTSEAPPAVADAGATPAPPSKPPVIIGETKDECTPVAVEFEKRARPKLKDCYAEGKKKSPGLEGTVKIKITVDVKGKIKATKVMEKTLPDPVANCMLGVVKQTPFPEVDKCWDATLTIPITFPTPK